MERAFWARSFFSMGIVQIAIKLEIFILSQLRYQAQKGKITVVLIRAKRDFWLMENSNKINKLSTFLQKVKQLRGFGDMDSYSLVREFKNLCNVPDDAIDGIIEDMASLQTWNFGKIAFIQNVENFIQEISVNQIAELS